MLLIVGTVPDENIPLVYDNIEVDGSSLVIGDFSLDIDRGTSALAAAACLTCQSFSSNNIKGLFISDKGDGSGSKEIFAWLINNLGLIDADVVTLHYIQPELNLHNKAISALKQNNKRPVLIADAGFMYVAKMSGRASEYDLFTPDIGEMAFLADENAPHPFYTRGFLLHDDLDIESMIERAYKHDNASQTMIVKGKTDYVASNGKIIERISEPMVANLEPIGGTGDTLTGIVSGLIYANNDVIGASIKACYINRLAGELSDPTPATKVQEIISKIPEVISSGNII